MSRAGRMLHHMPVPTDLDEAAALRLARTAIKAMPAEIFATSPTLRLFAELAIIVTVADPQSRFAPPSIVAGEALDRARDLAKAYRNLCRLGVLYSDEFCRAFGRAVERALARRPA